MLIRYGGSHGLKLEISILASEIATLKSDPLDLYQSVLYVDIA